MSKQNVEIAAFIGLDWADQQHAVCLQDAGTIPPRNRRNWIKHPKRCRLGFSNCVLALGAGLSPLPSNKHAEP